MMTQKKIGIFEPWNIGDLVIAVYVARELEEVGHQITIICDQKWVSWTKSHRFIKNVIPFHAPWTEKKKKYSLGKYKLSQFNYLRKELRVCHLDYLCDIRGDIRNVIFLNALFVCPVISIMGLKGRNGWERYIRLANKFNIKDTLPIIKRSNSPDKLNKKRKEIFCFFGSAWKNKRVPIQKAKEIASVFLDNDYFVVVILQPEDSKSNWSSMIDKFKNRIYLLQDSIIHCANLLSKASMLVSTDSGWLHVAYLYNVPTVGLFGFQNAEEWSPPGCRIIYSKNVMPSRYMYDLSRENIQPLSDISAEEIYKAVNNDT